MNLQCIKLYGERNCGTNYLEQLIRRNLTATLLPGTAPAWLRRRFRHHPRLREQVIDAYFFMTFGRNLGWKHMLAPDVARLERSIRPLGQTYFLFLVKNPYAWLLSLHRHPYHHPHPAGDFDAFIRAAWPTLGRENHARRPFLNPVVMWNLKNASYLRLAREAGGQIVRYEDLVADPDAVIHAIARAGGIKRKSDIFVNVEDSVKGEENRDFAFYRAYYLEERWRAELSSSAIQFINQHLDKTLLGDLRYHML
ncbi:MAG TPA: hypothetical protein EYP25_07535 [Anaerolineae bacterium]|nr:hypothetical protein [Anaerolineae bacterium]